MSEYDLAVVGAGPAGLAAARAAAEAGLCVALIDAGARTGGQYHRHPPEGLGRSGPAGPHHGWAAFARLRDAVLSHPRVAHLADHRVWLLSRAEGPGTRCFTVRAVRGERERTQVRVTAPALLIAAGAHDRALPFPGWDLPGVLTAGGAQALLKGDRVTAGRRVVVGGTGPFLLPVATALAAAGARVPGVYEANRPDPALLRLAGQPAKLLEAAGYGAALLRHRVPYRPGHAVTAAHGGAAVEAVTVARLDARWRPLPGTERTVECDTVAVGYGFTPQLELPLHLGCATRRDTDGTPVVAVDAAQRTSVAGVYAAGETTGVGGAQLALVEGELAGLAVALDQGRRPGVPRGLAGRRARLRGFAAALHRAYPVREGWTRWPRADTLVCRCEEVPRGALDEAVRELGATDARTVKLMTRAGMGWCQGRVCGFATACLTARADGRPPGEAAHLGVARRPFAQPVRLADLAAAPGEDGEEGAEPAGPAAGS